MKINRKLPNLPADPSQPEEMEPIQMEKPPLPRTIPAIRPLVFGASIKEVEDWCSCWFGALSLKKELLPDFLKLSGSLHIQGFGSGKSQEAKTALLESFSDMVHVSDFKIDRVSESSGIPGQTRYRIQGGFFASVFPSSSIHAIPFELELELLAEVNQEDDSRGADSCLPDLTFEWVHPALWTKREELLNKKADLLLEGLKKKEGYPGHGRLKSLHEKTALLRQYQSLFNEMEMAELSLLLKQTEQTLFYKGEVHPIMPSVTSRNIAISGKEAHSFFGDVHIIFSAAGSDEVQPPVWIRQPDQPYKKILNVFVKPVFGLMTDEKKKAFLAQMSQALKMAASFSGSDRKTIWIDESWKNLLNTSGSYAASLMTETLNGNSKLLEDNIVCLQAVRSDFRKTLKAALEESSAA